MSAAEQLTFDMLVPEPPPLLLSRRAASWGPAALAYKLIRDEQLPVEERYDLLALCARVELGLSEVGR